MIHVVGISHKTTPVDIREKLYFSDEEAVLFMKHLLSVADVEGVVILSTCNRTEIYFESELNDTHLQVWHELHIFKKLRITEEYYYMCADDCVKHLFSVASGLDSIVVGEYQILGQVKDAYRLSAQNDFSAPVLSHMFHKAFEAGKRAQNIQARNQAPVSSALAAVVMMSDFFQEKEDVRIIVYGAGIMASNVLKALIDSGFKNIQLFNRSEDRALRLAERYTIGIGKIANLNKTMSEADVLFTTTAAMYPVILPKNFEQVQHRILCFDLGLPRNIDPSVRFLQQVSLFTLDQIKPDHDAGYFDKREIQELFAGLLLEFNDWLSARNISPVIHQLRQRFDKVLEQRLQFISNKVSEREYELVRESGEFLRDKFLGGVIAGFKEHSRNGRDTGFLEKLQKLVEL